MSAVDAAVMDGFDDVLQPRIVERVVAQVIAWAEGRSRPDEGLVVEAEQLEQEIARLTDAIAVGGELQGLMEGLVARQSRLDTVRDELEALSRRRVKFSARRLERDLRAQLADWRPILLGETSQARGLLRKLLREPLTFTPILEARRVAFEGRIALDRMLEGLVDLPTSVASPRGTDTGLHRSNPWDREGCVA